METSSDELQNKRGKTERRYFYSKTNKMHNFLSLLNITTYVSDGLSVHHQEYIYLMLYVQSWTPDDGRKDRTKHVEWYSVNSKNCASSWFYYRNISRCTVPWTSIRKTSRDQRKYASVQGSTSDEYSRLTGM